MADICNKPIFAPDCIAINELFSKLSPLHQADNLGLLFSLYKHYINITQNPETFDEFYAWGETILSDFNDIDKYLVNAEQLFSNLYDLKAIENTFDHLTEKQIAAIKHFWKDFQEDKYTGNRHNFLQSWLTLYPLYKEFKTELISNNEGYEGLIYREVAENIKSSKLNEELPYDRYVFIGLNALNECEKTVLGHYKKLDKADFIWDFQSDMIQDRDNKAGFFLRDNIALFPQNPKLDFDSTSEKSYQSIAVPSNTGQTKIISELLAEKGISTQEQYNDTAIVLLDENLMIPLLHSLPENIDEYNITMGYPLKSSGIYTLFNQILNLQKNIRIIDGMPSFYHKNIISILKHSFVSKHFDDDCQKLTNTITEKNLIYTNQDILGVNDLFRLIFTKIDNALNLPLYFKHIFSLFLNLYKKDNEETEEEQIKTKDDLLEKEFLYHLYISISRFDDLIQDSDIIPGIDILSRLLRKHIDGISVPFYGEPLKGLQIMGILETRTLDFENIVFLSFNEGVFPNATPPNSFIPHNLRYGFGLPTIEHQDAISAYYFYRITQRAKNVWMVYNASNNGMQKGEISRFFSQLKYIYNKDIAERNQSYQVELSTPKPIQIQKDEKVLKKLQGYITKDGRNLSASALNNYIDCQLKFYLGNVEQIKEVDEVKEDIDGSTFGKIFHYTAEHLYAPYEGAIITKELLYQIKQNDREIEEKIKEAYAKEYFKSDTVLDLKGRHQIFARIIKKYIKQLFAVDMNKAPFTYRKGEQRMLFTFEFNTNKTANFIGFIDRVDEKDNITEIIDYKTGAVPNNVNKFTDLDAEFADYKNRKGAIFQTFLYSWAYSKLYNTKDVKPLVYYIRKLYSDLRPEIYHDKNIVENASDYYEQFEQLLKEILQEIYNPEIPFSQTENTKHCEYCEFKDICMR